MFIYIYIYKCIYIYTFRTHLLGCLAVARAKLAQRLHRATDATEEEPASRKGRLSRVKG